MKRILFVCVENSCRSQMAEAFGHIHKTDGVAVHSAGSKPSGQVNPRAHEVMAELDYDLSNHHSKGLEPFQQTDFDAVITMGCGDNCAGVSGSLWQDWALPDPKAMPLPEFRKVRDEIEQKVIHLLKTI